MGVWVYGLGLAYLGRRSEEGRHVARNICAISAQGQNFELDASKLLGVVRVVVGAIGVTWPG
jgi:hypothetical protein